MNSLDTVTEQAAGVGETKAKEQFRAELNIGSKDNETDFVTRADHEGQSRVVDELESVDVDNHIIREEQKLPSKSETTGPCYVFDPIDETNSFVSEDPLWTTSVGYLIERGPLASATVAPMLDDVFVAHRYRIRHNGVLGSVSRRSVPERCSVVPTLWWDHHSRYEYANIADSITGQFGDLKRSGSTQVELASLATGVVDGVNSNRQVAAWNTVAGAHPIRQTVGTVTDVSGYPWQFDSDGLVASNGLIQDAVLETVRL